jgi:hypothetical protein
MFIVDDWSRVRFGEYPVVVGLVRTGEVGEWADDDLCPNSEDLLAGLWP